MGTEGRRQPPFFSSPDRDTRRALMMEGQQKVVVGTAKAGGSLPARHVSHVSEEVAASVAEYLPATKRIPSPAVSSPFPD